MAKYLVTGGTGFVGSHLVAELLTRGEEVRVLDNFSTGIRHNLQEFQRDIEIVEGDIRSYHLVQEAVKGVAYVLHQAALPSVPRSVRDPITSTEVNVLGTLNLLQAARDAGVKRFVFASSSSIYGDNAQLPKVETMCPAPISPYAIAKLAAEQYCQSFWRLYQLETICLRYFNVFGPRQDPTSQYSAVIPKFITAVIEEQPVIVHGDGLQSRDFTYVANVVHANLLACTAPNAAGTVANVACGERHTLNDVIALLSKFLAREIQVKYIPSRTGDVRHSQAAIGLANERLGYLPLVNFQKGLEQTVDWYRQLTMLY